VLLEEMLVVSQPHSIPLAIPYKAGKRRFSVRTYCFMFLQLFKRPYKCTFPVVISARQMLHSLQRHCSGRIRNLTSRAALHLSRTAGAERVTCDALPERNLERLGAALA